MKPKIIASAVVAVVLALAPGAFAQFEATSSSPLGIGVSLYRPSGTELKDLDRTWLGVTLQYHVMRDEFEKPKAMVSIGWFAADKGTTRANNVPFAYTVIRRFGGEENSWYVGGGIDLFFVHYERVEYDPSVFGYRTVSSNGSKFGYNLVFGREFGGGWYIEAKRDSVAKLAHKTGGSIDFSGWSITFGSRLAY